MPEELCQVCCKSHYGSLAQHSDPSPLVVFHRVLALNNVELRRFIPPCCLSSLSCVITAAATPAILSEYLTQFHVRLENSTIFSTIPVPRCPRSSNSARGAWSSILLHYTFKDVNEKYTKGNNDVASLFLGLKSVGLRNSSHLKSLVVIGGHWMSTQINSRPVQVINEALWDRQVGWDGYHRSLVV